jgi:hypothetical protein
LFPTHFAVSNLFAFVIIARLGVVNSSSQKNDTNTYTLIWLYNIHPSQSRIGIRSSSLAKLIEEALKSVFPLREKAD